MIHNNNIRYGCNKKLKFISGIIFFICFILLISGRDIPITAYAEENSLSEGGETHAFYPAYATYTEQIKKYIDDVDSVSFAWSRIDASDPGVLNTVKGKNSNKSFYYPSDYLQPVRYAKSTGKSIQLSIYMKSSDCIALLPYSDKRELMIKAITDTMQTDITQGEDIYYDGVVIDFEGLRDTNDNQKPILYEGNQISTYFTQFLTELKEKLDSSGKKLFVAVNPRLYFNGYNYSEILNIADKVILMAHDYEPSEKLQKKQVQQYTGVNALKPINSMAPILMIRKALEDITSSAADTAQLSKIWLQICFDSSQWKYDVNGPEGFNTLEASTLSKAGRVTPLYKSIKDRLDNADGNTQNITNGYNNELQTPYIQYYNTSDKTWNIILYEDSKSLAAKIELAKAYGIGGISIWSLSNVPDFNDASGIEYHLDGWNTIIDEMNSFPIMSSDSTQSVSFTDTAVEQAVREKLGKTSGSITKYDLQQIYRLKLIGQVTTLKDLSKLQNLEYLDAGNVNLSNINGIESLKKLRVLYLQRNMITDLTPIKKLTSLEVLSVNGNQITSVTPLSALTNLNELYLLENKIVDITPLRKLTKLTILEIGTNKIKSLNAISSFKNLQQLSVENNEISDLKGLKNLTNLMNLNLANNKITDIQYLNNLTGLEKLYLQRNKVNKILALSGMKKLKELSLNGNKISNLKPLAKLTALEKLYLKDNKITAITSLKALTNLKELYLSGNQISDYSPVKSYYSNLQANCDFELN